MSATSSWPFKHVSRAEKRPCWCLYVRVCVTGGRDMGKSETDYLARKGPVRCVVQYLGVNSNPFQEE